MGTDIARQRTAYFTLVNIKMNTYTQFMHYNDKTHAKEMLSEIIGAAGMAFIINIITLEEWEETTEKINDMIVNLG